MPITIGKSIEIDGFNFNIKSILGKGGLSTVFLAEYAETGEQVAIKEFLYQQYYDSYTRKNDCAEFFDNEVLNTIAQANSGSHTVKVLHYEKKEDLQTPEYYLVLSLIKGITFLEFYREFIQSSRGLENLDLSSIVRHIFLPLAKHLDYCHSHEFIVHRDFSLNNIIIIEEENEDESHDFWPVLIDWGISKYVGEEWIYHVPKPYMTNQMPMDIPITQKGAPPEIKFGYMPTAASDIYYLSHLMYFVFTGGIMREDSEILNNEDYVLSPKSVNWYIPTEYNEVVKKMSQFEPSDRPKDMKTVIKMLEELVQIQHVHFDFEFFMDPDTNEITGEKIQ